MTAAAAGAIIFPSLYALSISISLSLSLSLYPPDTTTSLFLPNSSFEPENSLVTNKTQCTHTHTQTDTDFGAVFHSGVLQLQLCLSGVCLCVCVFLTVGWGQRRTCCFCCIELQDVCQVQFWTQTADAHRRFLCALACASVRARRSPPTVSSGRDEPQASVCDLLRLVLSKSISLI